ncbi:hypothetical protein ACFL6Y_11965, partial [Elusimicrobiota bacterium]
MTKSNIFRLIVLFLFYLTLMSVKAVHAVPWKVNYQGQLKESGLLVDGSKAFVFRITDSNGSTEYWTSNSTQVAIVSGVFNYAIGADNANVFSSIDWDSITPYLEVTIEGTTLTPREPLSSAFFAIQAANVDDGAISSVKLASDSGSLSKVSGGKLVLTGTIMSIDSSIDMSDDMQLKLGNFASLPVSGIGAGALVYRTSPAGIFYWDGSEWFEVSTSSTAWSKGDIITSYGLVGSTLTISPLASTPSGATGMVYYDANSDNLKLYNGSSWVDIAVSDSNIGVSVSSITMSDGTIESASGIGIRVSSSLFVLDSGIAGRKINQEDMIVIERNDTAWINIITPHDKFGALGFSDGDEASSQGWISYYHEEDRLSIGAAGADRMVVDSIGRVGIGTTSPSKTLEVVTSGAPDGIAINNVATDGDPTISLQLSGTSKFTIGVDDSDSDKFKIGASEIDVDTRLTIDNVGNIGIGTDAPTSMLDVAGNIKAASIDLGAGANDDLTAADIADLTDGGESLLHIHPSGAVSGVIRDQDTLQDGSTFYVSSASVQGSFAVVDGPVSFPSDSIDAGALTGTIDNQRLDTTSVTMVGPSIETTEIPTTVMLENENVSLLNNDAAYISALDLNVIISTETLQEGATFFVSSGTVQGSFAVVDGPVSFPSDSIDAGALTGTIDNQRLDTTSVTMVGPSIETTEIPTTVMLEGENVSLLSNDAGYITSVTGAIRDQSTLQDGATFYVSSGTVEGILRAGSIIVGDLNAENMFTKIEIDTTTLKDFIEELWASTATLRADFDSIDQLFDAVGADTDTLKGYIDGIWVSTADLRADVTAIESSTTTLQGYVDGLWTSTASLRADLDSIDLQFDQVAIDTTAI